MSLLLSAQTGQPIAVSELLGEEDAGPSLETKQRAAQEIDAMLDRMKAHKQAKGATDGR